MSILRPCPVSTESLTMCGRSMMTGEISTLGIGVTFEQVWDDACDEGLTLISHRTGTEVVYAVDHIESREGDILYWDLRPADLRDHALPTLRLFND